MALTRIKTDQILDGTITGSDIASGTDITSNNLTLSGDLRGPATFTIDPAAIGDNTGTVVIAGDLQVDGETTTINSSTLTVDDKQIVIASGATDNTSADGAGILIDGANAEITYDGTNDRFEINKDVNVSGGLDVDSGTLFVDSANNRVGVGTSSPSSLLTVDTVSAGTFTVEPLFTTSVKLKSDVVLGIDSVSGTRFYNDGSEAARIDSSGDLLVGTTQRFPASNNFSGSSLRADGAMMGSRSGIAGFFNRLGSDGEIARFNKDGSTVGSIGVDGGDLQIFSTDTDHGGLRFARNACLPVRNGSVNDADVNLGSLNRNFRDLYLSGGIYLGGTGSANKLDDYEEGTWTPTYEAATNFSSISYDVRSGSYVKIGNFVICRIRIKTDGFSGGSGSVYLSNLPFPKANNWQGGALEVANNFVNNPTCWANFGETNKLLMRFRTSADSNTQSLQVSNLSTGSADNIIEGTVMYITV